MLNVERAGTTPSWPVLCVHHVLSTEENWFSMSEHQSEPTTILEIKNQHSGSAPTIEINHGDYVSYWMNPSREPLVFVRRRGEDYATLYHSDAE
jgi:hypothetical protein